MGCLLVSFANPDPCADPVGGTGGLTPPPPLRNHQNIGFLSKTASDPLKYHEATELAFNVGQSLARGSRGGGQGVSLQNCSGSPKIPRSYRASIQCWAIIGPRIQRGGQGVGTPPLRNHQNIGFLSNTAPDPLKYHKATKLAFNVGQSLAH